jgi:hypothetical protein
MKKTYALAAACLAMTAGGAHAQKFFMRQTIPQVNSNGNAAPAATADKPHTGVACGLPSSAYAPASTAGATMIEDIYYTDPADQAASAKRQCDKKLTGPGVCFLTPSTRNPGLDLQTVWYSASVTTVAPSTGGGVMAINCNAK